jgi:hypothetical protein
LAEIGRELGITRQRVQRVLKLTSTIRLVPIRCTECGKVITQLSGVAHNNRAVLCLACLAKHPQAKFGQRLKALRLAAGLTLTALERRARSLGIHDSREARPLEVIKNRTEGGERRVSDVRNHRDAHRRDERKHQSILDHCGTLFLASEETFGNHPKLGHELFSCAKGAGQGDEARAMQTSC